MKTIYKISLCFGILCLLLVSCSEYDYENFVKWDKFQGAPGPISNIRAQSLPGEILLEWDVPADSSFYYVQIKYFDPLLDKEVAEVVSIYADELLVDNTRAKYGDYEFTFQTFNAKNEGGTPVTIKAKSGVAPIQESMTSTRLKLTVDQLSTNAQEPSEGPIRNLLDNSPSTFFHTMWSGGGKPWPHWIDIALEEPIENFKFYLQNRSGSQASPTNVDLLVSDDGITWEKIVSGMTGFPTPGGAEFTSDVIRSGRSFKYFRFSVNGAVRDTSTQSSFNLAQFALSKVDIETYDPEVD